MEVKFKINDAEVITTKMLQYLGVGGLGNYGTYIMKSPHKTNVTLGFYPKSWWTWKAQFT